MVGCKRSPAEYAGVTFSMVQRYKRGPNRISVLRLLQFSKSLGVDIQSFDSPLSGKSSSEDITKIDPKILKIVCSLNEIEDRAVLNQIVRMIKIMSQS